MKTYLVNNITIIDPERFEEYAKRFHVVVKRYGGQLLAWPTEPNVTVIEGDNKPNKVVIIEFPNMEAAQGCIDDPETQELWKERRLSSISNIILVEDLHHLKFTR